MDLYYCGNCQGSMIASKPLPQHINCPWCPPSGETRMNRITPSVDPTEMAKTYPPGTTVKHLLTGQDMTVLELEGDGSSGWFTARTKDFATHRVRYVEVEIVKTASDAIRGFRQYL